MSTRALIHFQDKNENGEQETFCSCYNHYDGYPTGLGANLAGFLTGTKLVNGISMREKCRVFNGMGCLAASFVKDFKAGPGGLYMAPAGCSDRWEEYVYTIYGDFEQEPCLRCETYTGQVLFDGPASEFDGAVAEAKQNEE